MADTPPAHTTPRRVVGCCRCCRGSVEFVYGPYGTYLTCAACDYVWVEGYWPTARPAPPDAIERERVAPQQDDPPSLEPSGILVPRPRRRTPRVSWAAVRPSEAAEPVSSARGRCPTPDTGQGGTTLAGGTQASGGMGAR